MEVMIATPTAGDFNFESNSACTSPYMSAPSSPPRFGTPFFSAPASPTRSTSSSAFYDSSLASLSAVPFNWEHKPGMLKPSTSQPTNKLNCDDTYPEEFAFDFSGHLEKGSYYLPADELFDGGKIKPLKPPPCLHSADRSPKSPRSPKRIFREAFSPRCSKRKDFDPFAAALNNSSSSSSNNVQIQRGRETNSSKSSNSSSFTAAAAAPSSSTSSRHHETRSLPPFRVSDVLRDQEADDHQQQKPTAKTSSVFSSASPSSWYRKWKIKDLLLFRSASEGRPSSKEHLKKYALLKKTSHQDGDDVKNASFRSIDSSVGRRTSGPISAHELHYTINRAVSEEMKKKTFLPYKQGLLGCLGFHHPALNELSRGIGSSMNRG